MCVVSMGVCEFLREAMVPWFMKYQNWSSNGILGNTMSGCCSSKSGQCSFSAVTMMSAALKASSCEGKCSGFNLWHSNISILQATNKNHAYHVPAYFMV